MAMVKKKSMQRSERSLAITAWLLAASLVLAGGAGFAQQPAAPAARNATPLARLPNGKPDLSGNWAIDVNLNDITDNIISIGATPVTKEQKKIPYTPVYAQLRAESGKRMYEEPELHCYMPGVPSHMWRQAYSGAGLVIQHSNKHIVFLHEFQGSRRIVTLGGKSTLPESIKLFMGNGTGRWQGDTLEITTTNNKAITWLDLAGNRQSDRLVITERFTPVDNDTYHYQATFTDPEAFTETWTIAATMKRGSNPDAEILEFACIEGNTDSAHYTEDVGGKSEVEKQ
jgi:hypothetical protein